MRARLVSTGFQGRTLRTYLSRMVRESNSDSIGVAVAYISVYGITFLQSLIERNNIEHVRIVTDVGDAVTHPAALQVALDNGWAIRIYDNTERSFHCKYYVTGNDFNDNAVLEECRFFAISSNNLSRRGLNENYESSVFVERNTHTTRAAEMFGEFWSSGVDLDAAGLAEYGTYFSIRNRGRSPTDILRLGASFDTGPTSVVSTETSTAAWAGLESFTGEYTFQVEFPRRAGEVLGRVFQQVVAGPLVDIMCSDGRGRTMRYRYYEDNSMFRLNIPNDVPGVDVARASHSGIAKVELDPNTHEIRLKIVLRADEKSEIEDRSRALGTLGSTPTRLYGWY